MNSHHSSIVGLNCMCLGQHMSPMKLHALHQVCIPFFQEITIKIYLSHHFGIIINYYSQGLNPLSLSPLSNHSSPFPLPTLWKLIPPSLFLRGRSACSGVYILLMILHNYIYKTGSWPLTPRLFDLLMHKPTILSHSAHQPTKHVYNS